MPLEPTRKHMVAMRLVTEYLLIQKIYHTSSAFINLDASNTQLIYYPAPKCRSLIMVNVVFKKFS